MVQTKMELELYEGRVYGARYLIVHPTVNWVLFVDRTEAWNDMVEWTVETFGPTPEDGIWTPGARWYVNNSRFYFRNETDRDWFVLRWT